MSENLRNEYGIDDPVETTDQGTQSRWTTVAPLVAWWWLVIAIATALILGFGFLRAVQLFARPLGVLILGVAIAASLSPLVAKLSRWIPRTLAVVLLYLALLLALVAVGWAAFPSFLAQLQEFSDQTPQIVQRIQEQISRWAASERNSIVGTATSLLNGVGIRIISLPLTIGESLLQLLLIVVISFYTLVAAHDVQTFILSLVPQRQHQRTVTLIRDMNKAMGGYVRGVMLSAGTVGIFTYVGLLLLGVPYPLVLALVAAAFELLPILGTLISTVIIVTVALFQSPQLGLFTLIFMVALQQIEGNLLFPGIVSNQAHISPLLSLVAFFAGSVVGGLLGALVAIPLTAALRVLVVELIAPMVRRWTGAKRGAASLEEDEETHARS